MSKFCKDYTDIIWFDILLVSGNSKINLNILIIYYTTLNKNLLNI